MRESDERSQRAPASILIVEDDAIIGLDLAQMIAGLGHRALGPVRGGREAVEVAVAEGPDLILMDIKLADDVDGLRAAAEIAQRRPTPVILVSANLDDEALVRGAGAGVVGCVPKPVLEFHLAATLRLALERARVEAERRAFDFVAATRDQGFRALLDAAKHGVCINDERGVIVFSNRAHHEMFGAEPGELIGRTIDFVFPDGQDRERFWAYFHKLFEDQPTPEPYRAQNRRADGRLFDVQVDWAFIRDDRGEPRGMISIIADVSEQAEAERQLEAALDRNRTLLLEVHHRVKNSIQLVSSLLRLHLGRRAETAEVLGLALDQVEAVSLAYETLMHYPDAVSVPLAEYLERIATRTARPFAQLRPKVVLRTRLAEVEVPSEQIAYLGLIVTELVSNAFRHGYGAEEAGVVEVEASIEDDQLHLCVRDSGPGLDPARARQADSRGLQLVRALAEHQLGGALVLDSCGGTCVELTAPRSW